MAKLEAVLGREVEDVPAVAPLFAALLAIPCEERYPPLALTPQQQKAKTLEALARQLETLAARRPALLIFEDLHWADPTSLELLGIVVDRIRRLPVLAVLTFRPDFVAPWGGHAHATSLSLGRLRRSDAAALAAWAAGGKPLPDEALDRVLARAEGVPLYVEELTRAVLESGLVEEVGDRHGPRASLRPQAIPATLYDSLVAGLDRLAAAKEVAQLAACIGREFSHDLLAAVSPLDADVLTAALDKLAASELIHRQRTESARSYAFRHALLQEAAYGSLLKSRRQELHAASRGPSKTGSRKSPRASPSGSRTTTRRRASPSLPRPAGSKRRGARRPLMGRARLRHTWPDAWRCRPSNSSRRWSCSATWYEHGGGREALLFVSPLAYGLGTIQPVLERLCPEFRIVTVDPRGSGASDPLRRPFSLDDHLEDVRAVIAALGDRPVVGVGISNSGNLLLKLAHAEPRLFTKLVAIGTPPGDFSRAYYPSDHMDQREVALADEDVEQLVRSHTERVFSEPEMRELLDQTIKSRLQLPRDTVLSFFDP